MRRIAILTVAFAVLSLVFINLLVFVRRSFPLYPLASYQDAFDILTPLVLIPLYWLLYRHAATGVSNPAEELAFMAFAALWAEGQGMHLSANSIDNLIEALARNGVIDVKATSIYQLTYFFDEHLGHYIWHIGMLGLSAVLVYHEWRHAAGLTTHWGAVIAASIVYGFTYFSIFIEGQAVALGLPFALIMVALAIIWGRRLLSQRPILAFFSASWLFACLLFAVWGVLWGGFPQFSDVGLI